MNKKHLLLFLFILVFDQCSKLVIDYFMKTGDTIPIISNFFHITYLHNTGAAWSMLEGKMYFFYFISILALIMMVLFYRNSRKEEPFVQYGLILMMAGTWGNFIDRLLYQYVRDFIDFKIFGYDFPVFNIADMALCIGVFLIIIDIVFEQKQRGNYCGI